MTVISHDLPTPGGDTPKIRFDPADDRARNGVDDIPGCLFPNYGDIFWDPDTQEYAGDIDDYPFICRRHGYAGQGDCKSCLREEGADIPVARLPNAGCSIPF